MGWGSILSGLFSKNSKVNAPNVPEYYTDPNYSSTQTYLKNYAESGLQGEIPSWYKAIGETMPESYITGESNSLMSDILGKANENAAIRGTGRGGALSSDTMSALGNTSANLRYSDYLRAMTGRENLLNTFLGTEEGVRDSAYNNQTSKNAYDQWQYGAQLSQETNRAARSNAASAKRWQAAGDLLDLAGSAATGGATGTTGTTSYASYDDTLSSIFGNDFGLSSNNSDSSLNFGNTTSGNSQWLAMLSKLFAGA